MHMDCDQCQAAAINGVFCHETGCPNSRKKWDSESETWRATKKCFGCGYTVWADEPCCDGAGCDAPGDLN